MSRKALHPGVLVAMSISALHRSQAVPQQQTGPHSPADLPEWWPLAQSGTFVPMEREQCWDLLGRSGTGWLSRPGAASASRQSTNYTLAGSELTLEPQPSEMLPIGQIVLFQVDHFDAEQGTAWSIALVGRTAEGRPEADQRDIDSVLRVFLPLASIGIFGLTLAAEAPPASRSGARDSQGRSALGSPRGFSSSRA